MLIQDQIHQGVEDHLKRYQIIIILIRIEHIQIATFKLVTQKINVIMWEENLIMVIIAIIMFLHQDLQTREPLPPEAPIILTITLEGHMKTGVDHQIITEPRDIQIIVAVDPIPHHKATVLDQGLQAAVAEVVAQVDVNF